MTATEKEIYRAWLLIKITEGDPKLASELAKDIYCKINLDEEYSRNKKIFVVRADLVSGHDDLYDLVVPICTDTEPLMEVITDFIATTLAEKLGLTLSIVRLLVDKHVPFPPHNAPGFVTYEEENPLKQGATGHNPW